MLERAMTDKKSSVSEGLLPTPEMIGEEYTGKGAEAFDAVAMPNFAVSYSEDGEGLPAMQATRKSFYRDANAALDLLED